MNSGFFNEKQNSGFDGFQRLESCRCRLAAELMGLLMYGGHCVHAAAQ